LFIWGRVYPQTIEYTFLSSAHESFPKIHQVILKNYKLFPNNEEERKIPNLFYVASITQVLKPDKGITIKENDRPVSQMDVHIQQHIRRTRNHKQLKFISELQVWFTI
jgi:hypothetical protein